MSEILLHKGWVHPVGQLRELNSAAENGTCKTEHQCDQTARILLNIWPFTSRISAIED